MLINGGLSGTATLTAAAGFSNAGTITLQTTFSNFQSDLTVTSGTLTNAAAGVINVNAGTGGLRSVSLNLTNNGTVNINTNATFSKTSGVYTNNGDFSF